MVKCLVTIPVSFMTCFLCMFLICVPGFSLSLTLSLTESLYRCFAGPIFLLYHWTLWVFLGLWETSTIGFGVYFILFSNPAQWKTLVLCFYNYRLLSTNMSLLYSSSFSLMFCAFWDQLLPQMLLPETVALHLHYKKARFLAWEEGMFVSSLWNVQLLGPFFKVPSLGFFPGTFCSITDFGTIPLFWRSGISQVSYLQSIRHLHNCFSFSMFWDDFQE